MGRPCPLQQKLELLELIAVAIIDGFEPLDLGRKLIDNAPGYDLLPSDPSSSIFIISFSEEQLDVE